MIESEYIGLLDSGVGGLSVLSQLKKQMPEKNYIYFGDTKNIPYGTKTPEEILLYTTKILDFFIEKNVKNVVIACNTTSAVAYEQLKEKFKNRLNIFPLIQSVAKKAILDLKTDDTIAILATKATINSKKYEEEIKKNNPNIKTVGIDCTGFVEIVENRLYNDANSINLIKEKLKIAKENNAKRIILGCTHYPYLENIFKQILNVDYFNPALSLAKIVKENIIEKPNLNQGKTIFYASKDPNNFALSAKTFFDVDKVELIDIT